MQAAWAKALFLRVMALIEPCLGKVKDLIARVFEGKRTPCSPVPTLPDALERARYEWQCAQSYYNSVSDIDLVDHAVYSLKAAEQKYSYLLKIARREGVTYSRYRYYDI